MGETEKTETKFKRGDKVLFEGLAWEVEKVDVYRQVKKVERIWEYDTEEIVRIFASLEVEPGRFAVAERDVNAKYLTLASEYAHELTAKEYTEKLKAVFGNVEKTDSGEEFPCQGMNCADCPFYLERRRSVGYAGGCTGMMLYHPDLALKLMEEWLAGRNTKKKPRKTYLEDFREKMPNAIVHKNGRPGFCRRRLYNADGVHGCEYGIGCDECWNEEMPEVSDNAEG